MRRGVISSLIPTGHNRENAPTFSGRAKCSSRYEVVSDKEDPGLLADAAEQEVLPDIE
jgi:hypothetical protein